MAVSDHFLAYALEQLGSLPRLRPRRMFGGVGLYADDLFFGLVDDDVLYLRVDGHHRADYVARGSQPFRPFKDRPEFSMSYYEVPIEVLEDSDELALWARRSMRVAAAAPRPAHRKTPVGRRPPAARKPTTRHRSTTRKRTR